MVPTLRAGDAVLVRRTGAERVVAGDVVVGRFLTRPDLLVVKRAAARTPTGWWLASDNEFAGDDSRTYGPAEVTGRVVLRYWPRPRLIRRGRRTG
jgi:phage repressor protein C with HTH and peptisase S24 domain